MSTAYSVGKRRYEAEERVTAHSAGAERKYPIVSDTCLTCFGYESAIQVPKDITSWQKVVDAAKVWKYEPVLKLSESLGKDCFPRTVQYHKNCRSAFVSERNMNYFAQEQQAEQGSKQRRLSREPQPSTSRVYEDICIFCDTKSKYMKGSRTRDPLVKCTQLRADVKVRDAATRKGDQKIMAIAARELVAAEAFYHRSCYRLYIKDSKTNPADFDVNTRNSETIDEQYCKNESKAFELLFDFIRTKIIAEPKVIEMQALASKMETILKSLDTEIKQSTKKHIKRKIENEFGDALHMFRASHKQLLIYPDNLSMETIVTENVRLQEELNILRAKHQSKSKCLKDAAMILRAALKDTHTEDTTIPPTTNDIESYGKVPELLKTFLSVLLSGQVEECGILSEKIERLIGSFAQDIIFAVSNGRQKPPKHILLPYAVKSLTGNVELIRMLNRLGHGLSYSQIEEIDTALCLQKMSAAGGEEEIILPESIKPHVFTTLAWDNIGRL